MQIKRFPLGHKKTEILVPKNSWILTAQQFEGMIYLWVLLDSKQVFNEKMVIRVYKDDEELGNDTGMWIATIEQAGSHWHVFEK